MKSPLQKLIENLENNTLLPKNWREKCLEEEKKFIEISNLEAIQEYLLQHGANDEEINQKIFKLKGI